MFERQTEGQPAPTLVFLARHGETTWNLERRFQGHGDSSLTPRGLEQTRRLSQRLAGESLAAVYASDLGRAVRTAEIVAAPHGLEIQAHPGLREIDTGDWTGRHRSAVQAHPEWANLLDLYRNQPWRVRMPGGETIAEVQARGLAALTEIASRHRGQAVAVVSHHVVVETIVARALNATLEDLWLPQPGGNCFLSVVEVTDDDYRPRLVYDGCHIGELVGMDGTKGEAKATG